jgi:hypothetical protein
MRKSTRRRGRSICASESLGVGPIFVNVCLFGEELGRDFLVMLWVFERNLTRFGDQDIFQKCV